MKTSFFKKSKILKYRLFYSMSIFSVALILALIISITMVLFYRFMQTESKYAFRHLDYIAQQLDIYLDSVDNYSKTILVDPDIQKAVSQHNDTPASFSGIEQIRIKQRINQIIQSIPYIHSVSIYSPEYKLIASTAIFIYDNTAVAQHARSFPVWYTAHQISSQNRRQEIPVLSLLRPFYNTNSGEILGYMDISIPEKDISQIYKSHTTEFNHVFFIDQQGKIQSSDGSVAVGDSYALSDTVLQMGNRYEIADNHILFSHPFRQLNWYMVNVYDLNQFFQPIYILLPLSICIGMIGIILALLIAKKLSDTITSPLYHLIDHIQKVKKGLWAPVSKTYDDRDIGMLFSEFNSMIIAQDRLKNDLIETQRQKDQTSLDLIQQQVNPHFLYNTLDNICSLAELDEKEMLIDLVLNLTAFYRKSLGQGKMQVLIKDELEMTRAYLEIMQIRYFNKFDYQIDADDILLDCVCLKLLLQPVVENSIYHGIKELGCKGFIKISLQEDMLGESLVFTVADNGPGITPKTLATLWQSDSSHFGIKNIHERILLNYGDGYGLFIESPAAGGCITKIKIRKEGGMA